jgi:hypothetical protein
LNAPKLESTCFPDGSKPAVVKAGELGMVPRVIELGAELNDCASEKEV